MDNALNARTTPPASAKCSKCHPEQDSFSITISRTAKQKGSCTSLPSHRTTSHFLFPYIHTYTHSLSPSMPSPNMFRRTTQDARSNPFTSSLSLASINSTSGSTTNDLPTTSTPTNNNATNLTDEEANHSEKSTFFTKFTKKGKKSKTPKIPVPTRKATPEEIRTFLAALLTAQNSQFADDTTKCDEIVSDWNIGGGVEVRQYGPAMYLEMFGREYGWILYREVRMSIRKESNILLRRPLCTYLTIYKSILETWLMQRNRYIPHRVLPPRSPDRHPAGAPRLG